MIAKHAFLERSFHLGLHVLMMFALYLRPTEALRLRCCDIIRPAHRQKAVYRHFTVVLHPEEEGVPSKTKEFDETLALDLPYHAGLGEALVRFMKINRRSGKMLVFNHDYKELTNFPETATQTLKLDKVAPVHPYTVFGTEVPATTTVRGSGI